MSENYNLQKGVSILTFETTPVHRYGRYFSELSFCVYLIFVFFGTGMPFQDRPADVGDIQTSNVINQWGYSILYLMSFLGLIGKYHLVIDFIKKEKWLSLFVVWALLSVAWSEYSFVSFKRWIQISGTILIFISFMINRKNDDQILSIFKTVLGSYLLLSALSIILVPGAVHSDGLGWRGLAQHKNIFGQACLVSTIVWFLALQKSSGWLSRLSSVFFILLGLFLLLGSKSITSLLVVLILGCFYLVTKVKNNVLQPMIGSSFSWCLLGTVFFAYAAFLWVFPEVLEPILAYFNKDLTLTGRTDLWSRVLQESRGSFLLGWGFGGFWVVGSPWIDQLYREFVWFPNQSHFGYLDIINETGLVGGILFLLIVISYFKRLKKGMIGEGWKWFFIATLILNLTESSIFRTNTISGTMLIFAYLAIFFEHNEINSRRVFNK